MKPFFLFHAASANTTHLRPDDLSRLAAHDLPKRREQVVLRHLAACSVCQAEWQAVQTLWQTAANANAALPGVPDAFRERIFATLPPIPATSERRFFMPVVFVRPLLGASVGIASAAAVLGVGLVYGPALVFHAPRAVAFQDVENAMAEVKTATWSETDGYPNHKTGKFDVTQAANVWVRLDPPTEVRKSTGYEGNPEGSRYIETERGTLSYTPGKKDYFLSDSGQNHQPSAAKLRKRILQALVFPHVTSSPSVTQTNDWGANDAPFKFRNTPWKSATVTLGDKPVLRFSRHSVRFRDDNPWWKKQPKQEYDLVIFADPQTYRIVQREWQQSGGVGGHYRTISDQFRYNETPPAGTFEVIPPPVGEPILFSDWTRTGLYAQLTAAEKKQSADVFQRLVDARNRNDWQAFSELRDFSYAPRLYNTYHAEKTQTPEEKLKSANDPRRSEATFRAEVEKNFKIGKPYVTWRINKIARTGYNGEYVYTRKSEKEPFPPAGPPNAFEIAAEFTGTTKTGKQEPQTATVICTRTDAGVLRVASVQFMPPRPPVRIKGNLSAEEVGRRAVFGGDFIIHPKVKKTKR